jgi:hypothetical protein
MQHVMVNKNQWAAPSTLAVVGLLSLFLAPRCWAQQTQPSAAEQQGEQPSASEPSPNGGTAGEDPKPGTEPSDPTAAQPIVSKDRLFWTLPNFLTIENAEKVPPLTAGQKFKVVARSSFDPVQYPYYGFLAGIAQMENSEESYGQGAAGYGKRYGSAFADGTIENFLAGAVFPSLFRQDPRYFQLGKGSFPRRTAYSVSRVFLTRSDSGKRQINFSEIFGAGATAGISNAYHPAGDRTVRNTMSVWGTQMGWDAVAFVVKEFWPDIRRKLHKGANQNGN